MKRLDDLIREKTEPRVSPGIRQAIEETSAEIRKAFDSASTPAPVVSAEEMRTWIAQTIYDVSNEWIKGNFPAGWQPRPLEDDERTHRLHLAYADALLSGPIAAMQAEHQAEVERLLREHIAYIEATTDDLRARLTVSRGRLHALLGLAEAAQ